MNPRSQVPFTHHGFSHTPEVATTLSGCSNTRGTAASWGFPSAGSRKRVFLPPSLLPSSSQAAGAVRDIENLEYAGGISFSTWRRVTSL